ncbi:PAS domain S-box protein [Opitutales bacterium ASA1]|nr:PAS domain S-box protein [Opitutales bacterium ASA1]
MSRTDSPDRPPNPDLLAEMASSVPGVLHALRIGTDGNTSFTWISESARDILGLAPHELSADGSAFIRRIHELDAARVASSVALSMRELSAWTCEFRWLHPSRGVIWLEGRSCPRRLPEGATIWHGVLWEVTDRKNTETSLRDREQRLRLLLDQLAASIWTTDAALAVTSVSGLGDRPVGPNREGLVGRNVLELVPDPATRARAAEIYRRALAGDTGAFDVLHEGRDVRCLISPFREADGTIVGTLGIGFDLSEQRNTERTLAAERDRMEKIAGTIPGAVHSFRLRPDGTTCMPFGAERVSPLFGIPAEELLHDASRVRALIHPDDQEIVTRAVEHSARTLEPWHQEYRSLRADGTYGWLEGHSVPLRDPDGGTTWHGTLTDVTERKLAEQTLRESQAQLRTTFAQLSEGVVVCRLDGTIDDWNPAALAMHGFTDLAECRAGLEHFLDVFELRTLSGDRVPADAWPFARILRGETLHGLDLRIRHLRLGWEKTFRYTGSLARDERGRPVLAVVHVSDVTADRRHEEEILALNAELEERVRDRTAELIEANAELEAFSYSVSHDLRAPLRTIDGFAQALIEDHGHLLSAEARRLVDVMRKGACDMGRLIDDLLAFAQLGRREIRRQVVDTHAIVARCLRQLDDLHRDRKVHCTVHALPASDADPALLAQVWSNLLGNAYKYTRDASPAVIEIGFHDEQGIPAFFVRDNGIGFDMRYLDKIFGVFQRLQRQEDFEGTGVGLAIVHRIITRHGGRIWAESRLGHGATFHFTLQPHPA